MPAFRFSHLSLVLVLVAGGLIGCESGDRAGDVSTDRYVVEVEGTVADTLKGDVHLRMEDDRLVGIELGSQDGPGLSIELEPQPLASRTYEVVDGELFSLDREGTPAGTMAFLTADNMHFEATDGTLTVEHVDGQTFDASFSFEMEGRMFEGGDAAAVQATGQFSATPFQEE